MAKTYTMFMKGVGLSMFLPVARASLRAWELPWASSVMLETLTGHCDLKELY